MGKRNLGEYQLVVKAYRPEFWRRSAVVYLRGGKVKADEPYQLLLAAQTALDRLNLLLPDSVAPKADLDLREGRSRKQTQKDNRQQYVNSPFHQFQTNGRLFAQNIV